MTMIHISGNICVVFKKIIMATMQLHRKVSSLLGAVLLLLGLSLLIINLYGLTQTLRPASFPAEDLRFGEDDISLSLEDYQEAVVKQVNETKLEYSKRLTKVIAQGTAHVHWEKYEPEKYNQLVPIWDNWILHFMGQVLKLPKYERYHYVTAEKSIERGIGLCGEVSMLMTSLLERNGIEASMLSFPGHVVVTAEIEGIKMVFDPDFGVNLPFAPSDLAQNVELAARQYANAGYNEANQKLFLSTYNQPFQEWDGPEHFITKKYYFEKMSYWVKWLFPLFCLILSAWVFNRPKCAD
jgi:hypothetical protein